MFENVRKAIMKSQEKTKEASEKTRCRMIISVVRDKNGGATIEYRPEEKIVGTAEDYELSNLLELGVKLEHVTMMNNMSKTNLSKYIEDFSRGHLEKINTNNEQKLKEE